MKQYQRFIEQSGQPSRPPDEQHSQQPRPPRLGDRVFAYHEQKDTRGAPVKVTLLFTDADEEYASCRGVVLDMSAEVEDLRRGDDIAFPAAALAGIEARSRF